MAIRQAIITYDSERVDAWDLQAEGRSVDWIFYRALTGHDYPRERGILSIRHIPEGNEIIVAPTEKDDLLMSYNACITLPLEMVEELIAIADKGASRGGSDRKILDQVRAKIAGTRKRFEDMEIVAVPRMKMGAQGTG